MVVVVLFASGPIRNERGGGVDSGRGGGTLYKMGVLPYNHKDNSDSTRASKSGKIQMLPDLPNVRMSSAVPKGTT